MDLLRIRNLPLRAKLAALLIAASALPLGLSAFIDIRKMRQERIADAQALLMARADQISREIDSLHTSYQRAITRVANQPAVQAYCAASFARRADHEARILGIFDTFNKSDTAIRGVALIDPDGRITVASDRRLIGLDLPDRPVLRETLRGNSVISPIAYATWEGQPQPTVAYMVPVRDTKNDVTCVVVLGLRAEVFSDVIKAAHGQAGPNSFAALLDNFGIRIGLSVKHDVLYHPSGPLEQATLDAQVAQGRFGPKTRQLLEDVRAFPEIFERARAVSPDTSVFHGWSPINNAADYGVARRLTTVPWTVFYMVPEANLQAELESATRSKIFLTLSIMAVAAGLGLAFAASILRQVKALSNATAELAAGNAYARVPAQGNDELGKLGISFNAMAEKIQRQADDLRRSHDGLRNHAEELEVANKDLEAFAFSVSHDLRAPLRVVGGFSRQLSSSFAGQIDDKAQHFLERIRAGVVMMEQLVEGLLRLSRLGRQALDSHPVDVAAIVHDVLAQLRSEQVLTNAEVEVSSYLPPAVGDHVLLRQVFTNLLSNACKFTAARVLPTINIGYELRDGENIYYVRDNGAGFDLAVASRLFEPFQRLHHDKDFVGLGIGLSIVKRIVQRHGGRIWFDAAEGKGACFYFTLGGVPAAESASP